MTSLSTLADKGFLVQAVLDVESLPDWVTNPINCADIDLGYFQRLVMLGQGGPVLWNTMQAEGFESGDRFDDYSRKSVSEYAEALDNPALEIIYPSDILLPLGRMAELAGWGRSSPLGLTINDEFGLWFAHRMVFLIDAPLDLVRRSTSHPCRTCQDTPCVTACPVEAVSVEHGFDVDACSAFRILEHSPCADRCLARLACPIGTEHTYGREQMSHHYAAGLESIRRWYASD